MKISYSCTTNLKAVIQSHNRKLLSEQKGRPTPPRCNCQISVKHLCPMPNKCNQFNIVYQATTHETPPRKYIGSTKNFKARYSTHKQSFKNSEANQTALSKHIWEKQMGENPHLTWDVLASAPTYKLGGRSCSLCLAEKLLIIKNSGNPCFLNKRTELAQKCRHKAEWRLDQFK